MKNVFIAAAAAVVALSGSASAQTITQGFTFSVANSSSTGTSGTHFHSSTAGDFGNPAGRAEVGTFGSEIVRGLSEYNLTGLSTASNAFVTFDVTNEGGLFGQSAFNGSINVVAYQGNNTEDLSDFQAAALGTVGTFTLTTAGNNVGNVFSFNITPIFNTLIANSSNSLGIRLEGPTSGNTAWTFGNFRLTNTDLSTAAVPEPATWAMMLLGFGMVAGAARYRRRNTNVTYA